MKDSQIPYSVRFYTKNPGGAYDPAPLEQFDIEYTDHPPAFAPGDILSSWERWEDHPQRGYHYYKVIDRAFRFDSDAIRVFVLVEEIDDHWTAKFG